MTGSGTQQPPLQNVKRGETDKERKGEYREPGHGRRFAGQKPVPLPPPKPRSHHFVPRLPNHLTRRVPHDSHENRSVDPKDLCPSTQSTIVSSPCSSSFRQQPFPRAGIPRKRERSHYLSCRNPHHEILLFITPVILLTTVVRAAERHSSVPNSPMPGHGPSAATASMQCRTTINRHTVSHMPGKTSAGKRPHTKWRRTPSPR